MSISGAASDDGGGMWLLWHFINVRRSTRPNPGDSVPVQVVRLRSTRCERAPSSGYLPTVRSISHTLCQTSAELRCSVVKGYGRDGRNCAVQVPARPAAHREACPRGGTALGPLRGYRRSSASTPGKQNGPALGPGSDGMARYMARADLRIDHGLRGPAGLGQERACRRPLGRRPLAASLAAWTWDLRSR